MGRKLGYPWSLPLELIRYEEEGKKGKERRGRGKEKEEDKMNVGRRGKEKEEDKMRKRGKRGKEEKREGEGGRQDERWEIFMIKIAFFVWK